MDPVARYFAAEQAWAGVLAGVGVLALVVGLAFWWRAQRPLLRGLAWPLALLATLQITVGSIVWLRSPHDAARVQAWLQADRARLQAEELPRMQAVMDGLALYRWLELGSIATGLVLVASAGTHSARRGVGLGLMIQAGVLLAVDGRAARRGAAYLAWLQQQV